MLYRVTVEYEIVVDAHSGLDADRLADELARHGDAHLPLGREVRPRVVGRVRPYRKHAP